MTPNLVENYIKETCITKTKAAKSRINQALNRITKVIDVFIGRFGKASLHNTKGLVDMDGIYAVGKVLQLEGQLDQAPTPVTINKHLAFIEAYIEVISDESSGNHFREGGRNRSKTS